MEYYELSAEDPAGMYSVLCTEDDDRRIVWRPEFRGMECSNCGKIDEEAAVARHVPSDLRVISKRDARRDVVLTVDNFLLVSRRFVEVIEHEGISGAKLLPLPSEDRFMLFIPERVPGRFELSGLEARFPTDLLAFTQALIAMRRAQQGSPPQDGGTVPSELQVSGMRIARPPELGLKGTPDHRCIVCRRHFATYGSIKSISVAPPADPLCFFTPSFNHESRGGNRFVVLCSEVVARLLLKHELTGFRFYAMDSNVQLRRSREK